MAKQVHREMVRLLERRCNSLYGIKSSVPILEAEIASLPTATTKSRIDCTKNRRLILRDLDRSLGYRVTEALSDAGTENFVQESYKVNNPAKNLTPKLQISCQNLDATRI